MPEGMSEVAIQAEEASSRLFDQLVDRALRGEEIFIDTTWEDLAGVDGGSVSVPRVLINGQVAQEYAQHLAEYVSADKEYCSLVGHRFEQKMADMWDDTIDFYEELDLLDMTLGFLAVSSKAPYYDNVRENLKAQGIESIGDGEMVAAAKTLARSALEEWVEAVESQQTLDNE